MTPHNKAKKEDVAKIVIMPGDPLRAKWIAESFMENARLINDVRGMLAYTGTYKGQTFTVMAHGMGIPSIGIYSYELFHFYDVHTIIRIGSAGAYASDIKLGDAAPQGLSALAVQTAAELAIPVQLCRVFCSDNFYNKYTLEESIQRSKGAKAVEMEGFALYANALHLKKQALMMLTCSDSLVTGEAMAAEARQTQFAGMVKLAFETAGRITLD